MTSPESHRTDEPAPEIQDRDVVVNGSRVHYLAAGDGPPLVLLHGLGDSGRDWQWVMPALARRARVLAPDLPGFGDSDRPRAAYSPAFFGGMWLPGQTKCTVVLGTPELLEFRGK